MNISSVTRILLFVWNLVLEFIEYRLLQETRHAEFTGWNHVLEFIFKTRFLTKHTGSFVWLLPMALCLDLLSSKSGI